MGLITKTVMVKWNGKTKRHYEDLGYLYTRIGDEFEVKIEDLTKGSNVKVKCKCDGCGKDLFWSYNDYNHIVKKDGSTYCQICGNNLAQKGEAGFKSFYDWCIESNKLEILDRWDYSLNSLSPKDVNYGSKKKFWFKCNKHKEHKSELRVINYITSGNITDMQCRQCSSLAQWFLDNNMEISLYWDYEKNGDKNPWEIGYGAKTKCWFKCLENEKHGSYIMRCNNFTSDNGQRCPYCSGVKVSRDNSIGDYIENKYGLDFLSKIWSDKNKKSPYEYTAGSNSYAWFKCEEGKHKDYRRIIINSKNYKFRCPECMRERKESMIEEKTRLYLEELGYNVLHEHDCTLRPINPKTKSPMPYDNEIILLNGKHLIIEVHGEQHYIEHTGYFKGKLKQRQLYDRYKKAYAEHYGYEYLEIPYTAFRGKNKNLYKQMIDEKIEKILHNTKAS